MTRFGAGVAIAAAVSCFWFGPYSASAAGPDADGDGIPDVRDKCSADSRNAVANRDYDSDCDGYGNACDADFDQSGDVSAADFSRYFVTSFKTGVPSRQGTDMDCSGTVDSTDFGDYFVPKFRGVLGGPIPGPSGLACAGRPGCGC